MQHKLLLFTILFLIYEISFSQIQTDADKCGSNKETEKYLRELYGDKWGYGYDSLLSDISVWETNDYIQIQSIGQSVQGREQYELTITDFSSPKDLKHRIYIHARTHPGEVQAFRVTEQIINYLSEDNPLGSFMRQQCIFHIIPMYNPDGVELEYPRENANGVDIESNWDATTPEIEVQNLQARFSDLMTEANPIEIALNMHSAVACKRYFVYHHKIGTTEQYAVTEQNFIRDVKSHFPDGIEPYTYYISWTSGTPTHYPESWWWLNYAEQVLALTYEDMNCEEAGMYQNTAYAILYGISDFLGLGYANIRTNKDVSAVHAYPNPFKNNVNINIKQLKTEDRIFITDILGRTVKSFPRNILSDNTIQWKGKDNSGNNLPAGLYLLHYKTGNKLNTIKLIKQ